MNLQIFKYYRMMFYMKYIWAFLKLIVGALIIATYMFFSFVVVLLTKEGNLRRRINSKLVSISCKLCLWGLNAKVKVKHRPSQKSHVLFVTNHLGFVDIFLLAAIRPSLFITSFELKETPGLGTLTEMAGCLYVERRNRANILNEVQWIRKALEDGFNVVLFPEAMATDGQKVHPFKRTLLTATAGTNIPIQPAVINYLNVNGEKMSDKWRDSLFWHGDQSFHGTLWRMLQLYTFDVEIEFFEPVHCHSVEQRHEIAQKLYDTISSKYIAIPRP